MKRRYLWLILILAGCLLVAGAEGFWKNTGREGFENGEAEEQNEQNKEEYVQALIAELPQQQAVQGPPGPEGPPGPPGGSFQARGSLLNVGAPTMRLDRLYGSGPMVTAYLADPNYRSHQLWTLDSNGQLSNQFGGCLVTDDKTGQTYMGPCQADNPPNSQLWSYDQYGRLVNKGNNQCLATTTSIKTDAMRGIIKDNERTGQPIPQDVPVATTSSCTNESDQAWFFL